MKWKEIKRFCECSPGRLHENSHLKREIWNKERVHKEWWGGEQGKVGKKPSVQMKPELSIRTLEV